MGAQSATKPISKGQCVFCQLEFAKNKMTQHLKACKQRQATIAAQEKISQQPKTRLFHILAEGRYSPEYWLHFELPDNASLRDVDEFLQSMWIDDEDHLSGFTINGTSYADDQPPFYFGEIIEEDEEDKKQITEEEEIQELSVYIDESMAAFIKEMDELIVAYPNSINPFSPEWIAEIKKPRSADELVPFLKEEIARLVAATKAAWKLRSDPAQATTAYIHAIALLAQETFLKTLLLQIEDDSIDVPLRSVLKVGQKFSYTYDFGSSTYINLKVIAERNGTIPTEDDSVLLLAQNTAPEFKCVVCGKPATQIDREKMFDGFDRATFCDTCVEEDDEGMILPLINSPRVGVL